MLQRLFCLGFVAFTACAQAASVQVFAAASLSDALREIAPAYRAAGGGALQFNLAGSSTLARQIREGAPADVFLSADEANMNVLRKAGLILEGTRTSFLSNTLVIVVAADSSLTIASPKDLAGPAVKRLALADPRGVPAGVYAKEYLEKIGVWSGVKDRVAPTENVRAALAAVEAGNAEAGIVYRTDALISEAVKVAYEVPVAEGPKISYPMAVLQASSDSAAAGRFLDYLETEPALAVFRKFGFLVRP